MRFSLSFHFLFFLLYCEFSGLVQDYSMYSAVTSLMIFLIIYFTLRV